MSTVYALPVVRPTPSFEPAREIVLLLSRQLPSIQQSARLGRDFQQAAISILIGEVQDVLEKYKGDKP